MPRCDAAPIQLGQTGCRPRPRDIASGRWCNRGQRTWSYRRATGGFDKPDFNEAKALLDELGWTALVASYPTGLSKRLLAPSRGSAAPEPLFEVENLRGGVSPILRSAFLRALQK